MKIKIQRFGMPYEPGKEKKKKRNAILGVIIFLFIATVIISIVSICIEFVIRHGVILEYKETWAASVPSYWGGIIGGLISGILSFLGVFYTIRYYKESDIKKEMVAVQPFLMVEISQEPRNNAKIGYGLGDNLDDKEKQKTINISIKNIGNGFAKTLVIHTGHNIGGQSYNKVINVGESAYTYFVLNSKNLKDGLPFALQYIDSMRNEYIQEYKIKEEYSTVDIECGYPYLLKQ